ncbi:MAG: RnfABCDGE type electron transport complex subunit D, partial [Clostridia bacterium]|nr:RnfABCDGE type electron transport complex subunit D [Clostridia bacterium]
TVAIFALIAGENPLHHLLLGGVVLGAVFMATDYVTSPVNRLGKLIFGFGCGFITMCIRLFGAMAEGVSFAILLMNIITPHIDRFTLPRAFGEERERA